MAWRFTRYTITLLFFLCSEIPSRGQDIIETISFLWGKHTSVDKIHEYFKSDKKAEVNIKRKIDANHWQVVIEYYDRNKVVNILAQGNSSKIYLLVLNELKNETELKNVLFNTDSAELLNYLSTHDSIYDTKTSPEDYKSFRLERYGRACGFGGSPTLKFAFMTSLCNPDGINKLRSWIKEPDYETKILGATGLLIMEQKGYKISEEDIRSVQHLKSLNIPINYCAGCTDWLPKKSAELLDSKLVRYYRNF